ncbi:unnamed protein product [Urochloa humidicola]
MDTTSGSCSASIKDKDISHAPTPPPSTVRSWPSPLVILSACLVLLGADGPLLLRVYFVHGGRRLWLSTMTQLSAWPLLLPPICVSLRGRREGLANSLLLAPRLVGALALLVGFFVVSCFVYSLGAQVLPVSTSSLLRATQLAFNAVLAFLFAGLGCQNSRNGIACARFAYMLCMLPSQRQCIARPNGDDDGLRADGVPNEPRGASSCGSV